MTAEQVSKALVKYIASMHRNGLLPERCDTSSRTLGSKAQLSHCLWACQEALVMASNPDTLDKAIRWMCWAQGVLWAHGFNSIDDHRNDNRSGE